MSLAAQVVDGKLVYNTTETTSTGNTNVKSTEDNPNSLGKDAFLQLLVAEMKYQDPLEPTSNTEYISQFTSFSELEQIQNMSNTMELQRASTLVGQYVLLNHTNEKTGEVTSVMGKVEYVFYENNKAYLHVNNGDYSLSDLDTIIDAQYFNASALASDFTDSFNRLPTLANMSLGYEDVVKNLREVFDNMSEYERGFLPSAYVDGLKEYEAKLHELNLAKAAEEAAKANEESAAGEDSGEGEESTPTV